MPVVTALQRATVENRQQRLHLRVGGHSAPACACNRQLKAGSAGAGWTLPLNRHPVYTWTPAAPLPTLLPQRVTAAVERAFAPGLAATA